MTGWILLFLFCALVCGAAAAGLIELHWNKVRLGPVLARWLRQLSDRLDKASPEASGNQQATAKEPSNHPQPEGQLVAQAPVVTVAGSQQGWYRVMPSTELLHCVGGDDLIRRIAKVSRLSPTVFERDLQPLLLRYAEFVQLMPASESHHHANAGGLLAHTLEVLLYAMTFRNGYLLPRGASAEVIDAERDFWTYAVFMAALLHDVGKPISDLRIQMRRKGISDPILWVPLGGSLVECGAMEYHIGFTPKAQRDYSAHSKLGMTLLQKLAPTSTLSFLSRAPSVLQELNQYLVGDGRDSAIAEIIKRADQESTKRNLASGSRSRLDTATSVPLVEQLMASIRGMLKQGTYLPLNRDGSAGWVFGDSIWFVAKRLADGVRDYIKKHAADDADGIPGESKNDRLFDTWQEYGCIMQNPQTGQAIWYVMVQGLDAQGQEAYRHRLSVLRFPLAKIWDSADQFPPQMMGSIEVLSKEKGEASADQPSTSMPQAPEALPSVEDDANEKTARAERPAAEHVTATSSLGSPAAPITTGSSGRADTAGKPVEKVEGRKVPVPKFVQQGKTPRQAQAESVSNREIAVDPDDYLDELDGARAEARAIRMDQDLSQAAQQTTKAVAAGPMKQAAKSAPNVMKQAKKGTTALPPVDPEPSQQRFAGTGATVAESSSQSVNQQTPSPAAANCPKPQAGATGVPRPVVLPSAAPPAVGGKTKEPSQLAISFMQWLQGGLADGSIKHNELGAPVHFVKHGMALVSPLIFREYASQFGESLTGEQDPAPEASPGPGESSRTGLVVQREVIRAGWHVPAPGGLNVWAFQVKKKGSARASRLSAVVLRDPHRWVMPVPPPNPYITPAESAETVESRDADA